MTLLEKLQQLTTDDGQPLLYLDSEGRTDIALFLCHFVIHDNQTAAQVCDNVCVASEVFLSSVAKLLQAAREFEENQKVPFPVEEGKAYFIGSDVVEYKKVGSHPTCKILEFKRK